MKQKILSIIIGIIAIATVISAVIIFRHDSQYTFNIMSDIYNNMEYINEINNVELSPTLKAIIPTEDIFIVKMTVLENDINTENEAKLVPLFEQYGAKNTCIGYTYLNSELITWYSLESFISNTKNNGIVHAIDEYEKDIQSYSPSTFTQEQLEEWINKRGYPSSDITMLDKISKLYGASFTELMTRYEEGLSIAEIKDEFGIVDNNRNKEYITISDDEIEKMANKFNLDSKTAEKALYDIVRLGANVDAVMSTNVSDKNVVFEIILREKFEEERTK